MSFLLTLFFACTAFGCIIGLIWLIYSISDNVNFRRICPVLKFKTFKKFYDLNPNRWELCDGHVECKIDNNPLGKHYSSFVTYERFCFGYFDTFRYKHWLKCHKKKEKVNIKFKSTSQMLLMVKQDIADLEKRAEHEKDSALDMIQQFLNNKEATK